MAAPLAEVGRAGNEAGAAGKDEELPDAPAEGCELTVKWKSEVFVVSLGSGWEAVTLGYLKRHVSGQVRVPLERLKVLGIKPTRGKGVAEEEVPLGDVLKTRPAAAGAGVAVTASLMVMGTRDEDMLPPPPPLDEEGEGGGVINDLDVDYSAESAVALWDLPENTSKLERAVKRAEVVRVDGIHAGPRPAFAKRKCLVLDIDYTFFDHRTPAERPEELGRPFLHAFMAGAFQAGYDIVLWSATSQKWIDEKMAGLHVYKNRHFEIALSLNRSGMFTIHNPEGGHSKIVHDVKPLEVLWQHFPDHYNRDNTIMFDDLSRNCAMNPQNGLRIRAFRNAHMNRSTDVELPRLLRYLRLIAGRDSLSDLRHSRWESYVEKHGGFGDVIAALPELPADAPLANRALADDQGGASEPAPSADSATTDD